MTVTASEKGHVDSRLSIGWCYLDPDVYEGACEAEQDVVKGWAIIYSVYEETDNKNARWILENSGNLLTSGQHEKAEALAEKEWLSKEPPLSNFPGKYRL